MEDGAGGAAASSSEADPSEGAPGPGHWPRGAPAGWGLEPEGRSPPRRRGGPARDARTSEGGGGGAWGIRATRGGAMRLAQSPSPLRTGESRGSGRGGARLGLMFYRASWDVGWAG